ncbi:uncharacterized protein N7500_006712 [Penicillium coprophilum]|uniref:uncharacterized protein n=1 Tax=Penicillium coprophilum TaxID=36646 RepID=UPI00239A129A|nr:uncharacterized protein N7500_006712 [Penicillium coprophilum]KAJ5164882.1 hypothetical protein N7500_006712 [Penicillium coprophilum]
MIGGLVDLKDIVSCDDGMLGTLWNSSCYVPCLLKVPLAESVEKARGFIGSANPLVNALVY